MVLVGDAMNLVMITSAISVALLLMTHHWAYALVTAVSFTLVAVVAAARHEYALSTEEAVIAALYFWLTWLMWKRRKRKNVLKLAGYKSRAIMKKITAKMPSLEPRLIPQRSPA